jgi:acyl dehydratase
MLLSNEPISPIAISSLYPNQVIDFGSVILSEKDIIEFASTYDPIPFHLDKEVAEKSHFKGLIASGPQLFHTFYTREWVPRFKHTVFAGKGITNWWLQKPVYVNTVSHCKVHIKNISAKPEKNYTTIHWFFEFTNGNNETLQSLDLIVLHLIE